MEQALVGMAASREQWQYGTISGNEWTTVEISGHTNSEGGYFHTHATQQRNKENHITSWTRRNNVSKDDGPY